MSGRVRWIALVVALVGMALAWPPRWYPLELRMAWARTLGAPPGSELPATRPLEDVSPEAYCPEDLDGWRRAQTIDGVDLPPVRTCLADNPALVVASVRGTNNVSMGTLMDSGLAPDAVEKGADLDGDGDPDEIHIRLEVIELNGGSPETRDPVTRYAIAPGLTPGFWVFAPKMVGMSTETFESEDARPELRLPSPAIRVEQGDRVYITLENSHYMPHTLHLHGTDHGFVDASGEGNDGVPIASELPVMPGQARTYELTPRTAGTKFYHCHVQPQVHIMMGLQGLFVIEENRPDNWLQTLNPGAGEVRLPSVAVREQYAGEYDLHYTDVDADLNHRVQGENDVRLITRAMHRDYNASQAVSDYFMLNGRSFPYTFRESLVTVTEGETVKLRVVNGARDGIALHTHGHSVAITHRDGFAAAPGSETVRDVVWLAPAQRLDLALSTANDGQGAYGPGIWLFHDHGSRMTTTDGIGPGGHISAIVYDSYLGEDGWPQTRGVSWDPYFTEAYYRRERPVWDAYAPGQFGDPGSDRVLLFRLLLFGALAGWALSLLTRRRG